MNKIPIHNANLIEMNMLNDDFHPKISVIVPCYNVEKYVEECLDSIIGQTYTNLEIILVDDGSKDSTGAIVDRYAEKDDRIVVIHKQNGGLSSARNAGLDIMTGELVSFIDSDDFIDTRLYQCVVSAWSKNRDADFVQLGVNFFHDGSDVFASNEIPAFDIMSRKKAIEYHVIKSKYNSVWNKVYKKKIFSSLRFMEGRIIEDLPVSFEVYYNSNKIININTYFYYYRIRKDSIMRGEPNGIYNAFVENIQYMTEEKYRHDKKFIKYANNCAVSILIKDFVGCQRGLLNDKDPIVILRNIAVINKMKSIRNSFNYSFVLYPSFKLESVSLYIKAKLFCISPKLLLIYDNPYLEFKLFVKRLLGRRPKYHQYIQKSPEN